MRTEDVLAAADTGLWRWNHATGLVTLDARTARLHGLAPVAATVSESAVRATMHPEDYMELYRVSTLVAVEHRIGEVRLRIVGRDGRVRRTVRARMRAYGEGENYVLTGISMEVPDHPDAVDTTEQRRDWGLSREAFLLDAGRALAEARTTDEVLRVAERLSLPGFNPDGLAVFRVDGDQLRLIGYRGFEISTAEQRRAERDFGTIPARDFTYPAAEAASHGRAVYLPDREEHAERYPESWQRARIFGRQAWAYLPLSVGGQNIGVWVVAFPEPVRFTPDERAVLAPVARMLAQALARAEVYENERELSADLQHTLSPAAAPEIPGAEAVARYVPSGGALQIGGDWYDVIPLSSGRVALIIGDVEGHDVRAAALMAQLRIALRAYAAEGYRPDGVLARASRFLSGLAGRDEERFATCLYLEADPRTGALEAARAGNPDLAVRLSDGETVLRPTVGGPPLGVVPDWVYPVTRMALQADEMLLLCTDGLLQTGGHDLHTGWVRLRRVIQGNPGDDLKRMGDALIEAVQSPPSHRTTGPLTDQRDDDIALLLFRLRQTTKDIRRLVFTVHQAEPARISDARRQLAELLHDWADPDQLDGAVLMVSEMLTNVLVHTDCDARMTGEISGQPGSRLLRVEVADESDELPHRREPGEMASSGRGLLLMSSIADDWGVDPRGHGKSTWFELREHEPESAASGSGMTAPATA